VPIDAMQVKQMFDGRRVAALKKSNLRKEIKLEGAFYG